MEPHIETRSPQEVVKSDSPRQAAAPHERSAGLQHFEHRGGNCVRVISRRACTRHSPLEKRLQSGKRKAHEKWRKERDTKALGEKYGIAPAMDFTKDDEAPIER
jgi:hypothetical protein